MMQCRLTKDRYDTLPVAGVTLVQRSHHVSAMITKVIITR
jgi:hypothetical protein